MLAVPPRHRAQSCLVGFEQVPLSTSQHARDWRHLQVATSWAEEAGKIGELLEAECCVDFFDLNCGCPLDAVCSKGMGAGMMDHQHRLREVRSRANPKP